MAKLKYWFKRLRCWLTGCQLSTNTVLSYRDEKTQMTTFKNHCVRCGQKYKVEVPTIDLLEHRPIRLEVDDGSLFRKKRS